MWRQGKLSEESAVIRQAEDLFGRGCGIGGVQRRVEQELLMLLAGHRD
jgi:hypothetical protein